MVRHFLLAGILSVVLLLIAGYLLRWYTLHGEEIQVPDYTGLMLEEVEQMKATHKFNLQVIDSVYDLKKKKGSIAFQDPPSGSTVKKHRTIYLTLVAVLPEQVKMPNLKDMTLRQAIAMLETFGLITGNIEYIPDIAENAVINQHYKGKNIEPGTSIDKGSRIDLVCGQGLEGGSVHVPFLLGKKREQAIEAIRNAFFVPGKEFFMDGNDTLNSRVYRQNPSSRDKKDLHAGQVIDLWYRSLKKVNFDSYIEEYLLENGNDGNADSLAP